MLHWFFLQHDIYVVWSLLLSTCATYCVVYCMLRILTYTHTHTYTQLQTYTHTHTYTRTHTYTHTHNHTHTPKQKPVADPGFQDRGRGHQPISWPICAKNCMKMKKLGPRGRVTSPAPPSSTNAHTHTHTPRPPCLWYFSIFTLQKPNTQFCRLFPLIGKTFRFDWILHWKHLGLEQ